MYGVAGMVLESIAAYEGLVVAGPGVSLIG